VRYPEPVVPACVDSGDSGGATTLATGKLRFRNSSTFGSSSDFAGQSIEKKLRCFHTEADVRDFGAAAILTSRVPLMFAARRQCSPADRFHISTRDGLAIRDDRSVSSAGALNAQASAREKLPHHFANEGSVANCQPSAFSVNWKGASLLDVLDFSCSSAAATSLL